MSLRHCSNCGQPVCRRCAQRRREIVLCPECVAVEAQAESPDFARALLGQHRLRIERRRRSVRTALATLLPGYGLLSLRRVFRPLALIMTAIWLALPWFGFRVPFVWEPRATASGLGSGVATLVLWGLVYACSFVGYLARARRSPDTAVVLPARARSNPILPRSAEA